MILDRLEKAGLPEPAELAAPRRELVQGARPLARERARHVAVHLVDRACATAVSGRFASRAAVVTGAGQGIGREIARQLALEGASVLLNDRDEALAREAARAIGAEGGVASAAGGDVADVAVTRGLVERAVAAFGRLDVAVANAGITLHCDFLDYRPEDFDRLLAVNLRGSFFLAQAAARRFREQGTPGRILFLSSVTGHMAIRQMAPYGMTKAALEALARNLSLEMAPLGITVNAVAPGATVTPRTVSDAGVGGGLGGGHPERPRGDRSPTWPPPRSSCCRTPPRTSPARAWSWTAAGPRWARCPGAYVP